MGVPGDILSAKWCSWCLKRDHNDAECWCTRTVDATPPQPAPLFGMYSRGPAAEPWRHFTESDIRRIVREELDARAAEALAGEG